jgi:hypothetical protein
MWLLGYYLCFVGRILELCGWGVRILFVEVELWLGKYLT